LPQASITRIIKAKLPDSVQVSKEAKQAFSKSAGIFILYLTAAANDFCKVSKRQTISAQDVLTALEELDFGDFVEPLKECLEG
jgi:DNA polymerase epsilon subunit 3